MPIFRDREALFRLEGIPRRHCVKGYIYIASAFETVNRSVCGQKGSWVDNDPHFWTSPPTWGICRNDLRMGADIGDFVFFVLPRRGRHPQMIFGVMKIAEKLSHAEAFLRKDLSTKRMANKMPNGNIIVDSTGGYNRFDGGAHSTSLKRLSGITWSVAERSRECLPLTRSRRLAPDFLKRLSSVLGIRGDRAIDIISRKGRVLSAPQVRGLLRWLDSPSGSEKTAPPTIRVSDASFY